MRTSIFYKYYIFGIILFLFAAFRLWLAASLPLTSDEAYYWIWAQHLQGGYFDHPFMVAVWIKVGTYFLGNSYLGVRFLGPISGLLGSWALFYAARDLIPSRSWPESGFHAVLLLNATMMIGVGSATMTPDTPLVFFISIFLFALGRAMRCGSAIWWIITGSILGLSFDSKYTGILILGALGLYLFFSKKLFSQYQVWYAILAFLVSFSPVVYWNYTHHWVSFLKQGGRTGAWQPERALQFTSELIAGQIGLATPIVFILFVIGLRDSWKANKLLFVLISIPLVVFIFHALGDRVQANWLALLYPICALSAVIKTHKMMRWGIISGILITSLIYAQAVFSILPFPAAKDPIQRQTSGWDDFVQQLIVKAKSLNVDTAFVVSEYGLASQLAFNQSDIAVLGTDVRWSLFNFPYRSISTGLKVDELHRIPKMMNNDILCRTSKHVMIRCYHITIIQGAKGAILPSRF